MSAFIEAYYATPPHAPDVIIALLGHAIDGRPGVYFYSWLYDVYTRETLLREALEKSSLSVAKHLSTVLMSMQSRQLLA